MNRERVERGEVFPWRMRRCIRRPAASRVGLTSARRFGPPTRARAFDVFEISGRGRGFVQHCRVRAPQQEIVADRSAVFDISLEDYIMAKRKNDAMDAGAQEQNAIHAKKPKADVRKASRNARKEKIVEETNALTPEDFRSRFVDEDLLHYQKGQTNAEEAFELSLVAADWLAPGEHNASFNLVDKTSKPDYESSTIGWHPRRKRKEMLEPEMKYFFVRRKGQKPSIERTKSGDVDTSILGFLSCMVTHDSSPSVPVLYIYEIHLADSLRGLGLGKHLMHVADRVAANVGLEKVMLTCFLCNSKAHRFYERQGFVKDVSSPEDRKTRNKVVAVDYVIMSKVVSDARLSVVDEEPDAKTAATSSKLYQSA